MIGTLLQPEIDEIVRARRWDDLQDVLADLDSSDVAELIEDLPDEHDDAAIFRLLPREKAASVFSHLRPDHQERLLRLLTNDQSRTLLEEMTPDDQARLLDRLPAEVTRRVLELLGPEQLKAARDLLGYPVGTAGRYMTPNYVALLPTMTAADAIQHVRRTARGKETLAVLYVLDEEARLRKEVRLSTLVLADEATRVGDIVDRPLVSIPVDADTDSVVQTFEKYDRAALPVVDADGHMLGIITVDDVLEFAGKKATRDLHKLGGSEALDAPYFDVGFFTMIRKRAGWLAALFIGETLTATAMGRYENSIERAAVLALFVPLIISSGGNSGSQATSILIRSLALQEVRLRDWWRVARKELVSGLCLGAFLGVIGLLRISLWYWLGWQTYEDHPYLMGFTVLFSLIGVVTFGSMVGSMLPFLLRRLGFDPATASAPFVATLVDVTGLVIYFTVASIVLRGVLL